MTKDEYITALTREVDDFTSREGVPSVYKDVDYDEIMTTVFREYAKPYVVTQETTMGASVTLSDWEDGFSKVQFVESPIDELPPKILAIEDFRVVPRSGAYVLLTRGVSESTTVRICYTKRHGLGSDNLLTFTKIDERPAVLLGASILFRRLAVRRARSQSSTIPADTVNYAEMTNRYKDMEKRAYERYCELLGLPVARGLKPALVSVARVNPDKTFDTMYYN